MKYLRLLKKYLLVFVGAVLFGLAAVKLKSAQRGENKANEKYREQFELGVKAIDSDLQSSMEDLESKQNKSKQVKENALKKLDEIGKHSGSVKSLLDDYKHDRMPKRPRGT